MVPNYNPFPGGKTAFSRRKQAQNPPRSNYFTTCAMESADGVRMGGKSWGYGSWILSTFLLVVGVLGAFATAAVAVAGLMLGDDSAPASGGHATALALASLGIIVAGGALRWSSSCSEDCDWDDED